MAFINLTKEQEKVIGRKKFNDVELGDDEKPLTALMSLVKLMMQKAMNFKIMRANMPFKSF